MTRRSLNPGGTGYVRPKRVSRRARRREAIKRYMAAMKEQIQKAQEAEVQDDIGAKHLDFTAGPLGPDRGEK
jgi:4-aminobutyrate aminotransferase-like enzyme